MTAVAFTCKSFDELSAAELYAMLALRSQVFVVEQQCVYLDPDGLDVGAHHLFGWSTTAPRSLLCGVRLLAPGVAYADASIGRVVTATAQRGSGLGRQVMQRALLECACLYPGTAVTIGAQQYLERFYATLGFTTTSAPYVEDGIPHVEMRRPA
jgi:ElaA protein